ncbi:MAG: tRNA pseudouridine(55) synthase [uncultured Acidimicrobiales bacterium]|uniref:tRNA pseudouridine synthase B n=1 Tax=uncultured Acidimicrobiales bacterium TaxID=310071 RepID=A0A6J4HJI4_9ACTN|nr:MAG: tRNA pseudouridine(55) synthase [uncultured Acidimicrobiales bacterium]
MARARRRLGTKKVGHAGTLDPGATGVLLLGVGPATRLLKLLTPLPKSYTCEVVLGTETSTLDDSGTVTARHDMAGVTLDEVRAAAASLTGDILQVPPMVSAIKVAGRRLHELAREGIEVERAARPVTVHRFEVEREVEPGVVAVAVDCSSGTYVRTLAADVGAALGGGAHLRALRRTAVGPFDASRARPVDEAALLPPVDVVAFLDRVEVDGEVAELVRRGRRLVRSGQEVTFEGAGPWAVVDLPTGDLLAVYRSAADQAVPDVVLPV